MLYISAEGGRRLYVAMSLTESTIRSLKNDGKTKVHTDGHGLVLEDNKNGQKYWKLHFRRFGRHSTASLGKWPDVSVKEAREAAARFRAAGEGERKGGALFGDQAAEWLRLNQGNCGEGETKRKNYLLNRHILPALARRRMGDISPELILQAVLRPVEEDGKIETAHRLKAMISRIFRYSMAVSRADADPTIGLDGALRSTPVRHRPAVTTPAEVGRLMDDISRYSGTAPVEAALRLLPYVFTRPGELRNARWEEIDFPGKIWRIPAPRMKMRTPHLVPLSRQSLSILERLRPYTGDGELVFPGRARDKPISDMAINAALRYLGYPGDKMCAHGFRAMASTILNENGYNGDWVERQLAHQERSGVRAAYNHADWLPERTRMMQEWADLLDRYLSDYIQSRGLSAHDPI
jgi:integrase